MGAAMSLHPQPVPPIGKRKTAAFVTRTDGCCGGLQEIEVNDYPEAPLGKVLRASRVAARLSLGDVGRLFSLNPEQVSGLETGRYSLTDTEWVELLAEIARGAR
jgi:hypothetical protein